ncbi:FAD-dependent oxidoreductase [Proteinivorax tanatarense]|uniref:FAD-dependent oxidoreductase n=1 Tax=Proteinivorax tanatarense TaxID=1260629 RepID=A0AAU7VK64_9FIRM
MRYAIIGAGFSGMLAAYLLEKKGADVTVYEKQEYIGGHCRTIVNKYMYIELATVFCFSQHIKELLIELDVGYTERFTYRNFLDENFSKVEHMPRDRVEVLMEELIKLNDILKSYRPYLNDVNYGYIPEDLTVSLHEFLTKNKLNNISEVIAPHLSSFGFGSIYEIQAYYAFHIFDMDTIYSFIQSNKLLFVDKGMSEVIHKLSQNISDIRYSIEVINIERLDDKVKVESEYGSDLYDKVLITTKLPDGVIKDDLYNQAMNKIDTNPYITCAYEVDSRNVVTTYYKANLGKKRKIQFFHTFNHNNKNILVAYAYGYVNKELVNSITHDIENSGIQVKHLITAKQWHIFPHLKEQNLTQSFYKDILDRQKTSNICLIGSLVSKPSISNLYASIKQFIG